MQRPVDRPRLSELYVKRAETRAKTGTAPDPEEAPSVQHPYTTSPVTYGLFRCEHCAENPDEEECLERCFAGAQWAEKLIGMNGLGYDPWPVCQCCCGPPEFLAPLVVH